MRSLIINRFLAIETVEGKLLMLDLLEAQSN